LKYLWYFSILLLLLIKSGHVKAQAGKDEIYLKDGRILKGTIIQNVPGKFINILIADKVQEIPYEEILNYNDKGPEHNARSRGFSFSVLLANGIDVGNNYADFYNDFDYSAPHIYIGPEVIAGYQFNRYFFLGMGLGSHNYMTGMTLLPLFANFRCNFLLAKFTPFGDISFGKTTIESDISTNENYKYVTGPMLQSSLGVKYFVSPKFGLVLSMGYSFRETFYYSYDDPHQEWKQNNLSSIILKFGINY